MGENKEDWFNTTAVDSDLTETDDVDVDVVPSGIDPSAAQDNTTISTATATDTAAATLTNDGNDNHTSTISSQKKELAEYCASQASDGGLRMDLHRIRSLIEKNKQATDRIFAMMHADFTDSSADIRGYSWLGNVLKFNEMKMVEWNDIIESKANFQYSDEGLEDLEDIVYSDWNELSDPGEMWEFDKNVDLTHRSHFADLVIDRPDSETPDDFAQRYEDEWDVDAWEHEHDEVEEGDDIENNEDNESPEEFSERYEDDWVDGDGDDSVAMEVGDDK